MKNFKGIAIVILTMMMGIGASAATVEISDASKGEVTVTVNGRQSGEYINILVAESDITIEEFEEDVKKLEHQGSVISGGTGEDKYIFTLNIPEGFVSGDYNVYISGETEPYNLYYIPFKSIVKIAKEDIVSETDKDALAVLLEKYKRELSIVNDLYNNADKVSIAEKLIASIKKYPISFADEAAAVTELQRRIKEFSCLSCFEENKKDVLYSADGVYLYNDIVPVENIDTDKITVNNIFNTILNDTGRSNVINSLFGKKYTDVSSFHAQYARTIILNGIKNSVYDGYGFLSDMITEGNADLAGLSISKYLKLSDKSNANRNIIKNKSSVAETNLEDVINNAASVTTDKPGNGNSYSGGGGGTGSGSRAPAPSIVIPSVTSDDDGQNKTSKNFSDTKGHWASDAIEYLAEKEILSGYSDNTFKPDAYVTREEACKIIAVAFNKTSSCEVSYSDVSVDDWFYPYVCALTESNIITGIADGVFGKGVNMTRESFAVLTYRLLGLSSTEKVKEFTDKDSISEWATEAVNALVEKGIINGFDDGSFQPHKALTRAEISTIIYSIISTQEG